MASRDLRSDRAPVEQTADSGSVGALATDPRADPWSSAVSSSAWPGRSIARTPRGFWPPSCRSSTGFVVPAANPEPAWRPLSAGLRLDRVCCLKYRRVVANDHTVRVGSTILQLPAGPGRRGYAGRRVELHLRLDGRIVVWDGERELLATPAPPTPSSSGPSPRPGWRSGQRLRAPPIMTFLSWSIPGGGCR
jgi:hypothetical protein